MKSSYSDGFLSIDKNNGFLPIKDPLGHLPEKYKSLQDIIDCLPNLITLENIKFYTLDSLIHDKLINYSDIIDSETDVLVIHALYRAYTFIATAYILEPCYLQFKLNGSYKFIREKIPEKIAVPLYNISKKLKTFPWLDHTYCYSLGNYVKIDKNKGLTLKNLKMACSFTNTDDETGIAMIHVYINELSKYIIQAIQDTITHIRNDYIYGLISSLELAYNTLKKINERKKELWLTSNYTKYNEFKIFLMGTAQELLKDGLVYEGVSDEKIKYYGSHDNLITTLDIFTGLNNGPKDTNDKQQMVRKYQSSCIQDFFNDLEAEMKEFNLFVCVTNKLNNLPIILLLGIVSEIYSFRFGHFKYIKKYILENKNKKEDYSNVVKFISDKLDYIKSYYLDIKKHITSILSPYERELLTSIEKNMDSME
jgi:indoleamine 2,3-dioxygenase